MNLLSSVVVYRICLTGGKEVHNGVMNKVQELAEAFSGYQEEVLVSGKDVISISMYLHGFQHPMICFHNLLFKF